MTRRRPQGGFTLIEMMIALLISSLLVGMILAIFSRMSMSYRGQQQIAGVQQVLAAARATIELDAKQAGLGMPQGFFVANDTRWHSPVVINDSSTGPDAIGFFYADTSTQAALTAPLTANQLAVDNSIGFLPGTLIVVASTNTATGNGVTTAMPTDPIIASYQACVLQIAAGAGAVTTNAIQVSTVAPWGTSTNSQCAGISPPAMVYNFVAHAYRIDTSTAARAALGPLQQSLTGGLLNSAADNWTELAYGFTDIQVAARFWHSSGADVDGDGDAQRDWYSSTALTGMTTPANGTPLTTSPFLNITPTLMTISLVARTDRDVEGITTAATPLLTVTANVNNNTLGDRASVALPSVTDPALQGSRIYRYVTFGVDLRNLGVGR